MRRVAACRAEPTSPACRSVSRGTYIPPHAGWLWCAEKVLRAETSGNRITATESWLPAGPQGHAGVVTIKKGPEFRAFLVCQSQQREQKRPRAPVDSFLGKFGDEGLD